MTSILAQASPLFVTIVIAFVIVLLALVFLGIGWILTGKSRIIRGACGMDPNRLQDKRCGTKDIHCDLCNAKTKIKREDDDDTDD